MTKVIETRCLSIVEKAQGAFYTHCSYAEILKMHFCEGVCPPQKLL